MRAFDSSRTAWAGMSRIGAAWGLQNNEVGGLMASTAARVRTCHPSCGGTNQFIYGRAGLKYAIAQMSDP